MPCRTRMRPPRFRTKDVSTCMGSPTARGSSIRKPFARGGCCLLVSELDRHLGIRPVSQLDTQPVVSPVNASRLPSRAETSCITRGRGGWLGLTPWKTCTSYPLPAFLAHSLLGHFRPRQRTLPRGPLPLRPRKLTSGPNEKLVAMGHKETHALQSRVGHRSRASQGRRIAGYQIGNQREYMASSDMRRQIEQLAATFSERYNKQDAGALANMFTKDAVRVTSGVSAPSVGRQADPKNATSYTGRCAARIKKGEIDQEDFQNTATSRRSSRSMTSTHLAGSHY